MKDETAKIRVLIADDHPAFREGLARLLAEEGDIQVVGQANDGPEAVKLAKELLPDVAIIDVAMPNLNGIETTKQIKAVCPATAILVVSAYGHDSYVLGAVQAGAAGYLLKNVRVKDLVAAIRALNAGEAVLDPTAAHKVFRRVAQGVSGATEVSGELHERELELLKLAAKGMTNKEIARELDISVRTVQSHLVNIFAKLEVGSRTEAVLHAVKRGWLTLDDLP
ncbi:MAG: DNA-binding response regulator [Chloroflexi bacterium RBG_13_54_9]|nr:MAG: DNA-binding response regulator [Chloroflexi bacterium RBG_13_54_9]